jgi:hypothetical protein
MARADDIQAEVEAVATAAARRAVRAALQDYWTAVATWEDVRRAAAPTSSAVATAQQQVRVTRQALQTCWQLHYGRPLDVS